MQIYLAQSNDNLSGGGPKELIEEVCSMPLALLSSLARAVWKMISFFTLKEPRNEEAVIRLTVCVWAQELVKIPRRITRRQRLQHGGE